jgi:antitoxin (DNA-binding transcriptional repressor) of toxin-antitoxin stability system
MATMTVTVQDMQQRFPELLSLVSDGNTIIIEKDKKPFAQLLGIDTSTKKRVAGLNREISGSVTILIHRCLTNSGCMGNEASS